MSSFSALPSTKSAFSFQGSYFYNYCINKSCTISCAPTTAPSSLSKPSSIYLNLSSIYILISTIILSLASFIYFILIQ